jgi:hypothetical protein
MTGPGIWVLSGLGLPCGARKLGDTVLGPAQSGRVWLDVCILGQHLPQMYRKAELADLTSEGCARLGLCPDCLGFGDTSPAPVADALAAARGIDQVRHPCANCGGSGRPALRVTVTRGAGGTEGSIRPLPHAYVPPLPAADVPESAALLGAPARADERMCLACGMPPDGTGPRGEALHP